MKTITINDRKVTCFEIVDSRNKEMEMESKGGKILRERFKLKFGIDLGFEDVCFWGLGLEVLEEFWAEVLIKGEEGNLESKFCWSSTFEDLSHKTIWIKENSKALVLHLGTPANRIEEKKMRLKTWKEEDNLEAKTTEAEIEAFKDKEEGNGGGVGGKDGPVGSGTGKRWFGGLGGDDLIDVEGDRGGGWSLKESLLDGIEGLEIGLEAEIKFFGIFSSSFDLFFNLAGFTSV